MFPWVEPVLSSVQLIVNIAALAGAAVVWRLYVANLRAALTAKDAEISSVEKNRDMWRDRVAELEKRSPEAMERVLEERIQIRDAEIVRLGVDRESNSAALQRLDQEKSALEQDLYRTRGFRLMLELDGDIEIAPMSLTGKDPADVTVDVVMLGEVGVDSGQLLITDPCYIDSEWKDEPYIAARLSGVEGAEDIFPVDGPYAYTYKGACHATLSNGHGELAFRKGHNGAGVAFATAWGDGMYPVYGERHDGRIVRVYINVA